jgi:biotin operon repressor
MQYASHATRTATQNNEVSARKSKFIQIQGSDVDRLLKSDLTGAEYKVYLYLCNLDPFGNRFVDLPSQSQIALELGLSRKTVNQAQAKLERLGLFEFKISNWKGRNLTGSRTQTDSPDEVTPVPKITHPVTKTLHPEAETLHLVPEMLHPLSSNPDSTSFPDTVHIFSDLNQTTTTPTYHPVVVDEVFSLENLDFTTPTEIVRGNAIDTEPLQLSQPNHTQKAQIQDQTHSIKPKETGEDRSSAAAAETEIFQEIKELIEPGRINPQVRALVLEAIAEVGLQVVKEAIAAMKEYKAHQKAKGKELANPVGTFRQALTEQWRPFQHKAPDDFREWYDRAYNLSLVRAASDKPDITRHPSGVQCVLNDQGEWITWDTYKMQYPIGKLREITLSRPNTF